LSTSPWSKSRVRPLGNIVRGVLPLASPGDRVEFVEVEPGRFEVVAATRSVTELKGMFGKSAKRVSIEDMNRAIAARGASAR